MVRIQEWVIVVRVRYVQFGLQIQLGCCAAPVAGMAQGLKI